MRRPIQGGPDLVVGVSIVYACPRGPRQGSVIGRGRTRNYTIGRFCANRDWRQAVLTLRQHAAEWSIPALGISAKSKDSQTDIPKGLNNKQDNPDGWRNRSRKICPDSAWRRAAAQGGLPWGSADDLRDGLFTVPVLCTGGGNRPKKLVVLLDDRAVLIASRRCRCAGDALRLGGFAWRRKMFHHLYGVETNRSGGGPVRSRPT